MGDRAKQARRKRYLKIRYVVLLLALAVAGALMDPYILAPRPPLSQPPERVVTRFTRCNASGDAACVLTGDSFRLGSRTIHMLGLRAPAIDKADCPAEAARGRRAADRLVELLNSGPFDLIAHRFVDQDGAGRDLRLVVRGDRRIGDTLVAEGLAQPYVGLRRGWC
ncbi:hypothetical protein ABDK56_07385 [Sphingomonas sp. ASV193]|uniref:hypothetical protein n=1 Tax=Sphingomonas sp. ASV193 TaxID=3144405 RepID=UPI0032E88459